jgi:hypothetical protein
VGVMYQMRPCEGFARPPPLMKRSVPGMGSQNNVYFAQPQADYVLCSRAITIK